jgi:hypothetical protein
MWFAPILVFDRALARTDPPALVAVERRPVFRSASNDQNRDPAQEGGVRGILARFEDS